MIHGGLQAAVMSFLCLIYGGVGGALLLGAPKQEAQFVGMAFIVVVLFIGLFSLFSVLPQLIGGWKMVKERPNARNWGIVGSIFACLSFPLGTAAGVFGLVFLFGDTGRQFYLGGSNVGSLNPSPAPPQPNSWR